MDMIVEGPPDDRGPIQDINIVDTTNWNTQHPTAIVNSNANTLLYIAVEYVKDAPNSAPTQQEVYSDFDPHVSPLDPNMSSVARYSPVYNEAVSEYNPVVIHQLVSQDGTVQNEQYINNLNTAPLENMPTVLCNGSVPDVSNQFLQMVGQTDNNLNGSSGGALQVNGEREQEVELLITDEATGISYSVNAQELLVERCLSDQQLLESLAPDPLLESELLALDDSTLKSELNDDIDISAASAVSAAPVRAPSSNFINAYASDANGESNGLVDSFRVETRNSRKMDVDPEDDLLSCVYTITDKPILTRARASLPEPYLVIGQANEENAVFAKKAIPKCSQFGPLEGVLLLNNEVTEKDKAESKDSLLFLIENDCVVYKMDVSDENTSNWMGFVRKAQSFEEQNLVISLVHGAIYFTTTTNILPKQELKVGYSTSYAQYFSLPVLQPPEPEPSWPCYECPQKFISSEELQNHLNVHDVKDENIKPKLRRILKNRKRPLKKYYTEALECKICEERFYQYSYNTLRSHLSDKHKFCKGFVEDHFTVFLNYECETCSTSFKSEALLKIHNLEHDPDSADEQFNHVCPACQKKCPTQRQLVAHVMQHALPKLPQTNRVKCPICYKIFALRERLQKHMLVHGSEEAKPLQCKTCNKRFLNNSALACHVKTHFAGKKVFECPICKESFDHVLKLKLHVPKHCQDNSYTCPHCMKVFKKYSIIRKHIRAFHCDRTHDCPHCTKNFPTVDKLRMHLLRHSDHREFLCADCGKQFKRKDKLKEHCKRTHNEERENAAPPDTTLSEAIPGTKRTKRFSSKLDLTDFHRFIYKCHSCLVGFKRRGMLVNHLAKRHPDIRPDSVPELNLPILQTTRDYYCQYCDKVYKSNSKRKAHILKNHPGAALPMSNRKQGQIPQEQVSGSLPNPTFSQTVGSITTRPQNCKWCHKQYASKAKLLQHQRKKHAEHMATAQGGGPQVKEEQQGAVTDIGGGGGGATLNVAGAGCGVAGMGIGVERQVGQPAVAMIMMTPKVEEVKQVPNGATVAEQPGEFKVLFCWYFICLHSNYF
ncbi:unnamed protein product [Acanthoscelides obtectus]|uniref:C2H2-type domain-containing protein n=1 Tax=Acanthoscelides obtectus TaxID=200917 RepID=A0A9P0LT25_ACAOB|nr:unnamed protein product [Acanthoscelides obtectus]CAK1646603.1 PR domain zinc finger protein 10 [Acanthoscelides obtectus]